MARARGDNLTGDLLGWQPPKVEAGFDAGTIRGSRIASQISQVVAAALKGHDREVVAQRMSAELGYPISKLMLDNYASERAEAHKISLERFIALIEATDCVDALDFIASRLGHIVVPERFGAIIEMNLIEQHEAELARHKQAVQAKLRGWKA